MKSTIAGHRCPRCQHTDIHGTRRNLGSEDHTRMIEEFFCPSCKLFEVADSDEPNYAEVRARWLPPAK